MTGRTLRPFELGSDAERLTDEPHLNSTTWPFASHGICPFADLVHRLAALNGLQYAIHAAKAQTRRDTFFDEAVILFEHIV